MSDIDSFSSSLLEEAKRFLELADECEDDDGKTAYRHAALMLSFCSLEAHMAAISEDFSDKRWSLTPHEVGLMNERRVRLVDGEFQVSDSLEMTRLEDRVQFLCRKFSNTPIDRTSEWWADLGAAIKLRNSLTHPKEQLELSQHAAASAILAIVETVNALYQAIYQRPLPAASRGLQSKLTFQ